MAPGHSLPYSVLKSSNVKDADGIRHKPGQGRSWQEKQEHVADYATPCPVSKHRTK